jgi:CIC family chloride channel protein
MGEQRRLRVPLSDRQIEARRHELSTLVERSRDAVLLAAVTGVCTGAMVRGFELAVERLLRAVEELPLWAVGLAPTVGLAISAIVLRIIGRGASPATTDAYLEAFHDRNVTLGIRAAIARLAAAVATIGSGGALGLEGPSAYGGATIGATIQRILPARLRGRDHRTLMVAGAAAGVAAIFKAPATGAIFALEVPFRGDLARRMLLPALVASVAGYLTFVALSDTTPLFRVTDVPDFSFRDLAGALLVGIVCAVAARAFAKLLRIAKGASQAPVVLRVLGAGAGLAALLAVSRALTGENLSIGPGYSLLTEWLTDPDLALWLIAAVLVIRCAATALTIAGGGVGGVFIPLVVAGALVGRAIGDLVHPERASLYTLLGVAALLGGGYRVPLAAVVFVAETTGRPDVIVPGVLAAVAAELVMGGQSVTSYQRSSDADDD